MTDTVTKPGRPRTLDLAAAALSLATVVGIAAAASLHTAAWRAWETTSLHDSYAKSSDVKSGKKAMPDAAQLHSDVNRILGTEVIIAVIGGALMMALAWGVYHGRYWARWSTVGVWALSTLFGSLVGLGSILSVGSDAPALTRVISFVGAMALVAACVLVNLRPSVAYLSLTRKPRPTRGLGAGGGKTYAPRAARTTQSTFGPLFGKRPVPPSEPAPSLRKPASTRPAREAKPAPTAGAPRPRSKARVDVTAPPAKAAADRSRGKSRKS